MQYPSALQDLIDLLRRFPGVGSKTAERFGLHLVTHFTSDDRLRLAEALSAIDHTIQPCSICGFLTDKGHCPICQDDTRDRRQILVVEEVKDVLAIEAMQTYQGLYHVLGGVITPSEGKGPDALNIKSLMERLKNIEHEEVILATNLSDAGELTARYIEQLLAPTNLTVSRIAHGLPAGGSIAYADHITLLKALEGRKTYQK